jgi:hypothetical protein
MYLFVYFFLSGIHLLKYLHFLATRCFFPFFATHSQALDSKSSRSSLLHRTSTNELLLNKRFGFLLYKQELGHRNPVDSWPRSLVLALASIFQHTHPTTIHLFNRCTSINSSAVKHDLPLHAVVVAVINSLLQAIPSTAVLALQDVDHLHSYVCRGSISLLPPRQHTCCVLDTRYPS